jgi:hypothetical protein
MAIAPADAYEMTKLYQRCSKAGNVTGWKLQGVKKVYRTKAEALKALRGIQWHRRHSS